MTQSAAMKTPTSENVEADPRPMGISVCNVPSGVSHDLRPFIGVWPHCPVSSSWVQGPPATAPTTPSSDVTNYDTKSGHSQPLSSLTTDFNGRRVRI